MPPLFNTAQELEEDVEMDEDYDIDHSNTKEAIQYSHAHDPFLVVLEPDVQSSFLLRTIPSSFFNEAFQAGLVGCYFGNDNELLWRLDVACGRVGCWRLRA
ncbi:hypothetical protein Tco_1089693 [Tanacetum coccineum]